MGSSDDGMVEPGTTISVPVGSWGVLVEQEASTVGVGGGSSADGSAITGAVEDGVSVAAGRADTELSDSGAEAPRLVSVPSRGTANAAMSAMVASMRKARRWGVGRFTQLDVMQKV